MSPNPSANAIILRVLKPLGASLQGCNRQLLTLIRKHKTFVLSYFLPIGCCFYESLLSLSTEKQRSIYDFSYSPRYIANRIIWLIRSEIDLIEIFSKISDGKNNPKQIFQYLYTCSVTKSCLSLCDLGSLPGSLSCEGFQKVRKLEWLVLPSPGNLSQPRIKRISPVLSGQILYQWATKEAHSHV